MFNSLSNSKLLLIAGLLVPTLLLVSFYLYFSRANKAKTVKIDYSRQISTPQVTSDPQGTIQPQAELLERLNNRIPLSPTDFEATNRLLSRLPEGAASGDIYSTATILIEYVQPVDEFYIQLDTENIDDVTKEKKTAEDWLLSQGFSQSGICNYPFSFILTPQLAEQYREQNIEFNPLPDGC